MYPQADLNILARRKRALLLRIDARREACCANARELARPLRWLESARRVWSNVSPFAKLAAVPAGMLAARKLSPWLGRLARWGPPAWKIYRAFAR